MRGDPGLFSSCHSSDTYPLPPRPVRLRVRTHHRAPVADPVGEPERSERVCRADRQGDQRRQSRQPPSQAPQLGVCAGCRAQASLGPDRKTRAHTCPAQRRDRRLQTHNDRRREPQQGGCKPGGGHRRVDALTRPPVQPARPDAHRDRRRLRPRRQFDALFAGVPRPLTAHAWRCVFCLVRFPDSNCSQVQGELLALPWGR